MKNSADLRGCYPPRSSASVDNTLLVLQNSSYPTQPHSIIANYRMHGKTNILRASVAGEKTIVVNTRKSNSYLQASVHFSFRPRPHVSFLNIRHFFFPDTASVHTHQRIWISFNQLSMNMPRVDGEIIVRRLNR